jgi:putative ABC transport system permease protein
VSWFSRLKNALNSRRLDDDLTDEIRDHVERRAEHLHRQGLTPSEAQQQAALAFGNVTRVREASRDLKVWVRLEGTLQDIRYAARGLMRNRVFAFTAIVSLGLAIGANTAIYSIVDAALLRPLPLPQPDRLLALSTSPDNMAAIPASGDNDVFSYPLYEQLRVAAGDSARLALFDSPNRVDAQLPGADAPHEEVIRQAISPDAFEVFGVPPALGSLFSLREDHYPGPRKVAVLSYEFWQRRFAGDAAILGHQFLIDNATYSIIGVARKGFSGLEPGKFVDVWIPITVSDPAIFINPDARMFHIMGRLAPGVGMEQLSARLQAAFHHHQELRIGLRGMPRAMQKHLREMKLVAHFGANGISAFRRTFARPLWILLGISACMLFISSANVASLLLARSAARAAEMAFRIALGARRERLIRQLLTESLLISSLAGVCGWVLASITGPALVRMVATKANPVELDLALDTRVLLFCAAICALSAIFFGLLPAWQATNASPISGLRHSGEQVSRLRLGRLFVGLQIAFAFCLVMCGACFVYSLRNLAMVDTGFDARNVTVLAITNTPDRGRQLESMREIQMRTAGEAQVQGAASAWMPVFSDARRAQRVVLPGQAPSDQEETFYRVSPGYFGTLRTPLLEGRDFVPKDNDNEPVPSVVNRAFARKYFGTQAVLGREFRRDDGVRHQIVGVAADSHFGSLRNGPEPIVYMPMKPPRAFTMYVRSRLNAISVSKLVEREMQTMGSELRIRDVTTLEALVGNTIRTERLLAGIGGAFAGLGLTLAAIGLFGLLNYSVTRRTREIGIRAALGARPLSVYALVLKHLSGTVAAGLITGMAVSLVLMHFARSLLFEVKPAEPLVIGTALAVFVAVSLIAAGLPAYRAATIDPIAALRHE